ncbi:GNAT family N-acetyltransferase [uncultured Shewanella sp.]|uniref:GNAT family N-acetyltransferase n=1 Tax=Shewanella atlantica TaxID=271099 RepID=UPI00260D77E2|nr:GNAT family N-acetyltransferase [uncultured Shewanella sp.]
MYSVEIETATKLTPELLNCLLELNQQIPEFDKPYPAEEYRLRLSHKPILIMFIRVEGELAGFKLGYELDGSTFYSWLGGVIPEYRNLGLAQSLLQAQESWARENNYQYIEVKTLNRFSSMLAMLTASRYQIIDMTQKTDKVEDNKIRLQKSILSV